MSTVFNLPVYGAGILLAAAAALTLYGQPDLDQKWGFMAAEYGARLENREVYVDPGELLQRMNDDYIELIIFDLREERDWNIFHLVDSERVSINDLPAQRDRLRNLSELSVVVLVSNDEILSTRAWKHMMALAKPNVYILEGGINHWLNVYGVKHEEQDDHAAASLDRPDGSLRHPFKYALGARHAAAQPDEHHVPQREYTEKVRLLKKIARAGGCG
jgi:rhodanese-related sulfurtransferase